MQQATLYYFHDPMCAWCWGYRPVSDQLFAALPDHVRLKKIVGGLAPDSNEPMNAVLKAKLPKIWAAIQQQLGTEFNYAFWTECEPRRSTYPACRAVLSAEIQGQYDEMVDAIQRAYYLRAMNPSDDEVLIQLAEEIALDTEQFKNDFRSQAVNDRLLEEVAFSHSSPIDGFPSLVLGIENEQFAVVRDYHNPEPSLEHINTLLVKAGC